MVSKLERRPQSRSNYTYTYINLHLSSHRYQTVRIPHPQNTKKAPILTKKPLKGSTRPSNMPGFFESSQNVHMEGAILVANCKNGLGVFDTSTLDTNNVLGNNNGQFQIGSNGWFDSAGNASLSGSSLSADLPNAAGQSNLTQIDLDS